MAIVADDYADFFQPEQLARLKSPLGVKLVALFQPKVKTIREIAEQNVPLCTPGGIEVDPTGHATNIRVQRSLGLGLDEKAIEAVKKWVFLPGKQNGKPVTVQATVEVNFRLL